MEGSQGEETSLRRFAKVQRYRNPWKGYDDRRRSVVLDSGRSRMGFDRLVRYQVTLSRDLLSLSCPKLDQTGQSEADSLSQAALAVLHRQCGD